VLYDLCAYNAIAAYTILCHYSEQDCSSVMSDTDFCTLLLVLHTLLVTNSIGAVVLVSAVLLGSESVINLFEGGEAEHARGFCAAEDHL
jgi:hypothetical protein